MKGNDEMTVKETDHASLNEAPKALVKTKKSLSIVWLVPVVALVIGGWLGYKGLTEKGPTITITFETAEGLEAGKTKIKYKDVEMGQVDAILLSEDLSHVILTATLVKEAKRYLSDKTLFWVVRARVAAGEVSGLGTLFSGAYIAMEPKEGGKPTKAFKGLEIPPIITEDLPGRHFVLRAQKLGSLDINAPVYYRQIKAGQVVAYEMEENGQAILIKVFIHAPFHELVRHSTRFWNTSGIELAMDASGIRVNTESLLALLSGGVAFETPDNIESGKPPAQGYIFHLYETKEATRAETYTEKNRWLLHFSGSVRGLSIGAPVEFRGIRIGQVLDVNLQFNMKDVDIQIPVLVEVEPGRLKAEGIGDAPSERKKMLDRLVEKGLRAQLKTGSFVTGQRYVDLDLYPNAAPAKINYEGAVAEFPTVPSQIDELTLNLTDLMEKLKRFPIQEIGIGLKDTVQGAGRLVNNPDLAQAIQDLQKTLEAFRDVAEGLDRQVMPDIKNAAGALGETMKDAQSLVKTMRSDLSPVLQQAIVEAQKTLMAAQSALSAESPLQHELKRVLNELSAAARSIRVMADYLERHPDALIRGKGN
jgi:paraquat-inducible protein B